MRAGAGTDDRDARWMRRALELAGRGWGRVHPNPMVGAVVVRGDEVVGQGWHAEYGAPHAEVVALDAAGDRAGGATLYVSLEPCAHSGKTPPCTDAIRRAGVARVVYGAADPHPEAGGGGDRLRDAGIQVDGGVGGDEARSMNAAFFHVVETGSPYVALKYALSLDSRLSARAGAPTVVSGEPAMLEAHRLRAGYDAILVGIGTVTSDDPRLTVRGDVVPRVPPARVVLDSSASLPLESKLVRGIDEARVILFCAPDAPHERTIALRRAGVDVVEVPTGPSRLALKNVLDRLWERGIQSVFCEGGGRVGAALLAADRVERMHLIYAPRLFGNGGTPAFPAAFSPELAEGWRLRRMERLGDDVLLELDRSR